MHTQDVDIIIVGGAMTGAALGLGLARRLAPGIRVAVVEAGTVTEADHPGFDARAIALSLGSQRILERLGLWQTLIPLAQPIRHIHVSDRGHLGQVCLDAADYHLAALGQVVELFEVGLRWHRCLRQQDSISLHCPAQVTGLQIDSAQVRVTLDSGVVLRGRLLVGADGQRSLVRRHLGGAVNEHDFGQVAIIANVATDRPHGGRAYERFTEQGPLALLPMTGNRSSLVWSALPHRAEALMQLDDGQFLAELQQAFGYRLGRFVRTGRRTGYPLRQVFAQRQVGRRCLILGNAAHALHPIAGQGFNLGLRDVDTLIRLLADAVDSGRDPGDGGVLQRYRQCRQGDQLRTRALTSGLAWLFSNSLLPLAVGRNLGLLAMQSLPGLKRPLVRQTLGLWSAKDYGIHYETI